MRSITLVDDLSSSSIPWPAPATTPKKQAKTSRLSSLQLGLAAYRERAQEQWKTHEFFRLTQGPSDASSLSNERMARRTLIGRAGAKVTKVCGAMSEYASYWWIYLTAWPTSGPAHSVDALSRRTDRRTTRIVWTLVLVALIVWWYRR
jgi:hypothetical protein